MQRLQRPFFWLALACVLGLFAPNQSLSAASLGDDVSGTVSDSAGGKPLPGGEVRLLQGATVVAVTTTDPFGRFVFHNLAPGQYTVSVRYLGFRPATRDVTVDAAVEAPPLVLRLAPAPINLEAISVTAAVPLAVDTRTGDQIFKQNDYHGAPTNTTSQILQQSIVGAARAPTGEVHIRGQHAEYTYYVDGIPVPAGISGSLNELFDPNVVNQIDFQTGSWDAEYGNKNAAIVNVTTRIPTGGLHVDASSYGGSYSTSGEALSASTNAGKLGFFLSGSRQATDMRREPVVADTLTEAVENFHNHGEDLFAFGKVQYVPTDRDVINLDLNRSRTRFQVPFDSTQGVIDDNQQDINGFVNLGWRHRYGESEMDRTGELFVGGFFRDGSLHYTPGKNDQPSFIFYPDTTTPYNVQENRSFRTFGVKLDYTLQLHHGLEFKAGTLLSATSGTEAFTTVDSAGNPGPASNSSLKGSDVGVYLQTAISPSDRWELRLGARFDNHNAPFAGNQHQVSPRIKLSFFPTPATTLWAYYGRLFLPTNVEDLRAITSVAQGGVAAAPTLPERDDFVEVGLVHRFPAGVVTKLSAYHKSSSPGIDDNTVPGSAITTSVNIDQVRITGIEGVIEIRPPGPVSGYVNVGLNHAYGFGAITGGFFPTQPPSGAFDLDHDQRLSSVASVLYSSNGFFVGATGIYGSGLTNGNSPDSTYGTGLLDFNRSIKVTPSFILNLSAGYAIAVGSALIRPQLYVDNLFNHKYLLKGAFFSGASFGRPRTVELRLNVGL
jgi:outer membrane receptor for ferrienterochelin and colicin